MNIQNIEFELKFLNQVGQTLDIDERIKLDLALNKLTENYASDLTLFWGKIEGISRDYFIAVSLNLKDIQGFPNKKFFWTNSDLMHFSELPQPNLNYINFIENQRNFFTGQHEFIILNNLRDQPNKTTFTELDRLSIVVNQIENECQVVPEGAYKFLPSKELRLNQQFRGLKIEDCLNQEKYYHFKQPSEDHLNQFLMRDNCMIYQDFLENISKDQPNGSWSIQSNQSKTIVTLRSLLWMGYVAYHRTNSGIFGGAYIGTGIKNLDLAFIRQ